MIIINESKILLVLSLTLCSALVAESLFGIGKSSLQKFESWLEQQGGQTYEANYANALQYVNSRKESPNSYDKVAMFIEQWKILHEARKNKRCYEELSYSVEDVEDDLGKKDLKGTLSRILKPLLKEINEICSGKAKIYSEYDKIDVFTQANNFLLENTKSNDIIDNIEVAREFLSAKNNDKDGEELQQLLKDFVALKPLVEQSREGKLVCSDEDMKLVKKLEDRVGEDSPYNAFSKLTENDRLIQFVITLSEQVGKVCLEKLVVQFKSLRPRLDYNRVRALKQFSNFDDDESYKPSMLVKRAREETPINLSRKAAFDWADRFVRMNVALYGEQRISLWDPLERTRHVPIDLMEEKFEDVVVGTCNHIEREDLIPILEETLRIARNIGIYPNSAPGAFVKNGLADVASNYVVCKRLKNVDQSRLIENIAQFLPEAEHDFSVHTRISLALLRYDVESGC